MRVRVKICGIQTVEDARVAVQAGADAIGVVLSPARRQVSLEQAGAIVEALPPFVSAVGVFANAAVDDVTSAANRLRLSAVQLHGDEPPEACVELARAGWKVIKAVRVGDTLRRDLLAKYPAASAVLLDTEVAGLLGGTGRSFRWNLAAGLSGQLCLIVAGGLTPANVGGALDALQPYGVDVASGVETAGRKDPSKLLAFVHAVRRWEAAFRSSRNPLRAEARSAPE